MNDTPVQKHFTISQVAARWHELMIPRRIMRPSSGRAGEKLGPTLQHADTQPPQSSTPGLDSVASMLPISRPAEGRRLS